MRYLQEVQRATKVVKEITAYHQAWTHPAVHSPVHMEVSKPAVAP
jgi:hypothetical protein